MRFNRKLANAGILCLIVVGLALTSLGIAQSTKITLWTFIDPAGTDVRSKTLAHIIDTFEAKNPGITVVPDVLPWQQIDPSLLRASKAGKVPDLAMLYSPSMPTHIAANTLMPLNSFINKWPDETRSDIVILPEDRNKDGTVFGIPWEMRVSGLVYRQDVLTKAGLKLPQSLQELAEDAKSLTAGNMVGLSLGFSPKAPSIAAGWFLTTLVGMGEKVLNEDGSAAFATPGAERLVQWVQGLIDDKGLPQDVALLDNDGAQQLFVSGRAVFLPSSSQHLDFIRETSKLGDAVQMMAYPTFVSNQPAPALVQGWSAVIPRGAQHPDAAWKFIEYWTSPEIQDYQAKNAGEIPVRKSVLDDPWFQSKSATPIRWAVNYAASNPLEFDFPADTNILYDVWAKMFERVITGQMNAKQALEWAETEYDNRTMH